MKSKGARRIIEISISFPRLIRGIRDMLVVIGAVYILLWLVKSPGNLEWWRAIGMGAMLPIIKKFL